MLRTLTLALLLLLGSCSDKFEKFRKRYGSTYSDTTYQTVSLTIPRDSAVIRLKTDTTRIIEKVRQGRATVTIIREPTYTTVVAECDSATAQKVVATKIDSTTIGVDPAWETKAKDRMGIIWGLVGLLVAGIVVYVFLHKLKLNVEKR